MVRAEVERTVFRQDALSAESLLVVVGGDSVGMGDVLPPKRQTVVDRHRKRFEVYRRHHNNCLSRYEQSASALYEKQHQDTLLFRQRFLESKAKKAKNKNDHHRTNSSVVRESSNQDPQKLVTHTKPVKRGQDGHPSAVTAPTGSSDHPKEEAVVERSVKPKQSTENLTQPPPDGATPEKQKNPTTSNHTKKQQTLKQQQRQQASATLNFSVQVVQQLANTSSAQPQQSLSQTVQNNVAVNTYDNAKKVKVSGNTTTGGRDGQTASATVVAPAANQNESVTLASQDCKQENDQESNQQLRQFENRTESCGDRFSDTFPTLGFAGEDSNGDDVIHPDILKDLIDDVFINSADIMKDFNFDDSVGSLKESIASEKDEIGDLVKDIKETAAASELQQALRNTNVDNLIFNTHSIGNQQQQPHNIGGMFNSGASAGSPMSAVMNMPTSQSSLTYVSQQQQQQRLMPYRTSSIVGVSGLNLDFKLTEPSPAALTLKQMAEQHQNMQKQHQQHMNQGMSSSASGLRMPFDLESLTNPNFRSRFLGNIAAAAPSPPSQKQQNIYSSNSVTASTGYESSQQSTFPGVIPLAVNGSSEMFKQNRCGDNNVNVASRQLSEGEKQRQNLMQLSMSGANGDRKTMYGSSSNRVAYFSDSSNISQLNSNLQTSSNKFMSDALVNSRHQQQISDSMSMGQGNAVVPIHQQVLNTGQNITSRSADVSHNQFTNMFSYNQTQQVNNGDNLYNVVPQQHQSQNAFASHYQTHLTTGNRLTATHHKQSVSSDNGSLSMDQISSQYPQSFSGNKNNNNPQRFSNSSANQWRTGHQLQHQQQEQTMNSTMPPSDVYQHHQNHNPNAFAPSMNENVLMQQQHQHHSAAGLHHHHPYKSSNHIRGVARSNLVSPTHASMLQQQQQTLLQNRPATHTVLGPSIVDSQTLVPDVVSPLTPTTPVYSGHHPDSNNQISLDFLDNIDGTSASDLLNFDQAMHNPENHFPLLDEMLGK